MTQPSDDPPRPHRPLRRLARVVLDGEALTRLSPILEADRAQAVADLAVDSRFAPVATGRRRPAKAPMSCGCRSGRAG